MAVARARKDPSSGRGAEASMIDFDIDFARAIRSPKAARLKTIPRIMTAMKARRRGSLLTKPETKMTLCEVMMLHTRNHELSVVRIRECAREAALSNEVADLKANV